MVWKHPLQIGVILLLFTIPYFCDIVLSNGLGDSFAQQVMLETDFDEDKSSTIIVPFIEIVEVSKAICDRASGSNVFQPSVFYDSQTILAVSGSRPPPVQL